MDPRQPGPTDRSATKRPETVLEGSDAAALADELGRIQLRSIDGRRLRARIESVVDHDAETVRLWYRLPHGAFAAEEFEKPMPWSARYKFARVIEDLNYSPSSLAGIEGEEVVLERVDDDWRIEDPDRRRGDPFVAGSTGATGPVAGLGFLITVLYLVVLFVATTGAMSLIGALAVAAMLCSLALLVAHVW